MLLKGILQKIISTICGGAEGIGVCNAISSDISDK